MTLKLGIIGQTGQLAKALKTACISSNIAHITLSRKQLDLAASDQAIRQNLKQLSGVNCIINAAAYTAVDNAESDSEIAFKVNAHSVRLIAEYCKQQNIPLIHISTDYVFNGKSKTPYTPDAPTDPIGVYGSTKLQGEKLIRAAMDHYAILRTSWVYSETGKNFMTTMLRLAMERDQFNIVSDQLGRPTYAADLAKACLISARKISEDPKKFAGTYHVSNTGPVISWADFARAIFDKAQPYLPHNITVKDISSDEYPTAAQRPAYSAMNVSKFEDSFDVKLNGWEGSLQTAISNWAKLNA